MELKLFDEHFNSCPSKDWLVDDGRCVFAEVAKAELLGDPSNETRIQMINLIGAFDGESLLISKVSNLEILQNSIVTANEGGRSGWRAFEELGTKTVNEECKPEEYKTN